MKPSFAVYWTLWLPFASVTITVVPFAAPLTAVIVSASPSASVSFARTSMSFAWLPMALVRSALALGALFIPLGGVGVSGSVGMFGGGVTGSELPPPIRAAPRPRAAIPPAISASSVTAPAAAASCVGPVTTLLISPSANLRANSSADGPRRKKSFTITRSPFSITVSKSLFCLKKPSTSARRKSTLTAPVLLGGVMVRSMIIPLRSHMTFRIYHPHTKVNLILAYSYVSKDRTLSKDMLRKPIWKWTEYH